MRRGFGCLTSSKRPGIDSPLHEAHTHRCNMHGFVACGGRGMHAQTMCQAWTGCVPAWPYAECVPVRYKSRYAVHRYAQMLPALTYEFPPPPPWLLSPRGPPCRYACRLHTSKHALDDVQTEHIWRLPLPKLYLAAVEHCRCDWEWPVSWVDQQCWQTGADITVHMRAPVSIR